MKNNNSNNILYSIKLVPAIIYPNADTDKFIIYAENINKSGVYK
jgi:hypothetical protein